MYKSRRELLSEQLENDGELVWAVWARAAMAVCLDWLAVLLQLDNSGNYSRSLPDTVGKLLLIEKSVEAQTGQKDFIDRGRLTLGYFSTVVDGVNAFLYVTPGWHTYIDYHRDWKDLRRRPFVVEEVKTLPSSIFEG